MEKTNLFGPLTEKSKDINIGMYLDIRCPVCGKVTKNGYKLDDGDNSIIKEIKSSAFDVDDVYYSKPCDCCMDSVDAYEYCYTCGRPKRLHERVSGYARLESSGCDWCYMEKKIRNIVSDAERDYYKLLSEISSVLEFYNSEMCSFREERFTEAMDNLREDVERARNRKIRLKSEKGDELCRDFDKHLVDIGYNNVKGFDKSKFEFKFD